MNRLLLIFTVFLFAAGFLFAQQPVVTPVDIDDEKPREQLHYYDKHGNPLDEPVRFITVLDTVVAPKAAPVYPLYNGVNVGLNFGDLIFMAFGQKFASVDAWANVSLHNWIFPTLETGIGWANAHPDKQNYHYRSTPAFYLKAGANYNFLYKSDPAYQIYVGLRAGFSSFSYKIDDVTITNDYWQQTQRPDIPSLHSTAFYGEALAGLQVKIVDNFSLGWSMRWHFLFHASKSHDSKPWFIPGYGGSSPFGFAASAIWTFPAQAHKTIEQKEN